MPQTSFDELYTKFNTLVTRATGRRAWRKGGLQAQPAGVYATVMLSEALGMEKDVVEDVVLAFPLTTGETIQQVPWGTATLDVRVEFFRSGPEDTALQAAQRLRAALRLEERFWDLWEVCSLSGAIRLTDVSAAFRADVEPRAELRFSILANIVEPLPLADVNIHEIDYQEVDLIHVGLDGTETTIVIDIDGSVVGSS